jgi:hypothetical protein
VLPGGKVEALVEDVLEMEAEDEVPEVREFVERAVTPEEPAELAEDAEIVVEDVVVADVDAEELPLLLIEEVDSLSSSLLADTLTLMLEEDKALVAVLVPRLLTELNLPGNRFKCVSLSSVTTSLPTDFLK